MAFPASPVLLRPAALRLPLPVLLAKTPNLHQTLWPLPPPLKALSFIQQTAMCGAALGPGRKQ